MGLQLSVLIGCIGAVELLACLKHVIVCVFNLTDSPSNCYINYFHRSRITDDFVIVDKPDLEKDNKQTCSEIEAILLENKSEPNILCIGGPPSPTVDGYVRIPTPIPFGVDEESLPQKSSSNASSLVDSGNENPTAQKADENLSGEKRYNGSSSDVSSLEDTEGTRTKLSPKKVLRRSRTPEVHQGSWDYDDYDDGEDEEADQQKKHQKSVRRSARSKLKTSDLGRSAENLTTSRRSKRHREPERCKSDIQIQVTKNLLRDEWTNTSPVDSNSNLSRASSKRSISVLIQTSFEDKLHFPENNSIKNATVAKLNSCPTCRCAESCDQTRVRQVTETDGKPRLLKISSFEEASGEDYEKIKSVIAPGASSPRRDDLKKWTERIKSSVESESFDEYVDAEEDGITFCEQPIQYSIPDPGDNQAFWVISRSSGETSHVHT